nr:retrotransposon protein, putative, Ty1-copia subclass [Tanacetum cinerariifolium]
MVLSMMNLLTFSLSFLDYALESAARILNMVPTKKVDKTPYELWIPKGNDSGRAVEPEESQHEYTSPSESTSEIPMKVKGFEPPQEEVIPIRKSERTHRAPESLCLNVEVKEHSLGDLNEPINYKATILDPNSKILDPDSDKWLDAMNAEMQSMIDNTIWVFVDLPPNCKTIGRNHIPSLQNVKNYLGKCFAMKDLGEATFILRIKIYRERSRRLIRLSQSAYMDKILKRYRMDNTKRGYIPMQKRLDLNKTQGASIPREVKHMKNVPYASVVGSIIYAIRCTIPDVPFAQNITSRFQQNPGEPHWTAVKTILKYSRNTKDMFLVYGGNPKAKL